MVATNVNAPRPTPAQVAHEAEHNSVKNEAPKAAAAPVEAKEADAATKAQSTKNQTATKSGANPAPNAPLSKIEKEQVGVVVQAFNQAYQGAEKGAAANALAGNELAEYLGRNEKLAGAVIKQLNAGKNAPDWGALVRDTPEPAKTFVTDKAWPSLSDEQKKGVVAGLIGSSASQTAAAMIMSDLNSGRNPASLVLEASRSGLPLPDLLEAAGPRAVSNKLGDFMVGDLKEFHGVKEMFEAYDKTDSPFRKACDAAKIGPDDLNRLTLGVVTGPVSAFFTDLETHPSAAGHAAGAVLLRGEAGGAEALKKIDLTMAGEAHSPEAKAALEKDAAARQVAIDADLPVAERMEKARAQPAAPHFVEATAMGPAATATMTSVGKLFSVAVSIDGKSDAIAMFKTKKDAEAYKAQVSIKGMTSDKALALARKFPKPSDEEIRATYAPHTPQVSRAPSQPFGAPPPDVNSSHKQPHAPSLPDLFASYNAAQATSSRASAEDPAMADAIAAQAERNKGAGK